MHKSQCQKNDDKLKIGDYFYLDEEYTIIKIITLQKAILLKCTNKHEVFKVIEEDCNKVDGYICECLTESGMGDDY